MIREDLYELVILYARQDPDDCAIMSPTHYDFAKHIEQIEVTPGQEDAIAKELSQRSKKVVVIN
jgi:hypothetical protein